MDILTKMIKTKHKINDIIFEEFWNYCKSQGINQQCFYAKENKQKLIDTIYDFIELNYKKWKENQNQIHVKNESRYIREYLENLYNLDILPF